MTARWIGMDPELLLKKPAALRTMIQAAMVADAIITNRQQAGI